MTVAFSDAVHLTEMLRPSELLPAGRDGLEWEKVAPLLRAWFWERKRLASVVNIMSVALYDLFGGADGTSFLYFFFPCRCGIGADRIADLAILREGCFRYFELGGEAVAGPVSLLSAYVPSSILILPLLLAYSQLGRRGREAKK